MPLSKEQLQSIIAKSKNVLSKAEEISPCKPIGGGDYNDVPQRPVQRNQAYSPYDGLSFVDKSNEMDNLSSMYGEDDSYYEKPESEVNIEAIKRSKMPSAIKESIMNNPITQKGTNTSNISVLDSLGIDTEPSRPMAQQNEGFKNMLRECIKDVLSETDDNALRTIQLKSGKIRLVDNSGRVFVANLEYKGNVNDNKKK